MGSSGRWICSGISTLGIAVGLVGGSSDIVGVVERTASDDEAISVFCDSLAGRAAVDTCGDCEGMITGCLASGHGRTVRRGGDIEPIVDTGALTRISSRIPCNTSVCEVDLGDVSDASTSNALSSRISGSSFALSPIGRGASFAIDGDLDRGRTGDSTTSASELI